MEGLSRRGSGVLSRCGRRARAPHGAAGPIPDSRLREECGPQGHPRRTAQPCRPAQRLGERSDASRHKNRFILKSKWWQGDRSFSESHLVSNKDFWGIGFIPEPAYISE